MAQDNPEVNMSRYGQKAIVKTWYELVVLSWAPGMGRHVLEESLGLSPTRGLAYKKAKRMGLPLITDTNLIASDAENARAYFVRHYEGKEKAAFVREVTLVHTDRRKTIGRRLGAYVYVRKPPRFNRNKPRQQ